MSVKRAIALLTALILAFSLTGCMVNASARPSTDYKNIGELIRHYEKVSFSTDTETSSRFLRDLAGIIQKGDPDMDFSDWKFIESPEEGSSIYEKEVNLYGVSWTLTVAVNKNYVSAVSMIHEGDDSFSVASALSLGMYDKMGTSYSTLIDGEKASDRKIKALLADNDGSRSFAVIWPRSSVKWSGMIQYDPSGAVPKMAVKIL